MSNKKINDEKCDALKKIRVKLGLSPKEMACKYNFTHSEYKKIESGEISFPVDFIMLLDLDGHDLFKYMTKIDKNEPKEKRFDLIGDLVCGIDLGQTCSNKNKHISFSIKINAGNVVIDAEDVRISNISYSEGVANHKHYSTLSFTVELIKEDRSL